MKIKQTVKMTVVGIFAALVIALAHVPGTVQAAADEAGNNGCGTDTTILKCDNVDVTKDGIENTGVWSILLTALNILTAAVGVVALAGVVYGAILYTSAGGSQEQIKKAMDIFTNVVIGVIAYAVMFSALNFLIPGGIFRP